MGNLIGFKGFLNTSAPLNPYEYDYVWKGTRRYHDFQPGNAWIDKCEYPRFWNDMGKGLTNTTLVDGCRDSEFDQVFIKSFFTQKSSNVILVWRNRLVWKLHSMGTTDNEVRIRARSTERMAERCEAED